MEKTHTILRDVLDAYAAELTVDEETVRFLIDMKSGLVPDSTGDDGRRRYENIKLTTTYSTHRERALQKRLIEYSEAIGASLKLLVEATIKAELAKFEIMQIGVLRERMASNKLAGRTEGIYPETRAVIETLFEDHQVTRWHFVNATDGQIEQIANILWRRGEDNHL